MPFELFDFIFWDEVLWIPRLHLSQLFKRSILVKPISVGAGWDGRTWLRLWSETSNCDEFHDGRLNDLNLCHNQSRKNALVVSWWRINGADSQHNKLIHSNIKKVVKIHFMEEVMGKIIKEIVCENGDCSNKRIKVLPLIGLIAINAIIGVSFTMFCFHVLWRNLFYFWLSPSYWPVVSQVKEDQVPVVLEEPVWWQ